jgi:hypothetical protein
MNRRAGCGQNHALLSVVRCLALSFSRSLVVSLSPCDHLNMHTKNLTLTIWSTHSHRSSPHSFTQVHIHSTHSHTHKRTTCVLHHSRARRPYVVPMWSLCGPYMVPMRPMCPANPHICACEKSTHPHSRASTQTQTKNMRYYEEVESECVRHKDMQHNHVGRLILLRANTKCNPQVGHFSSSFPCLLIVCFSFRTGAHADAKTHATHD